VWWNAQSVQTTSAPITVVSASGGVTKWFDQSSGGGQWVLHGTYTFDAGTTGYVEVSNAGSGRVSADAVRFVPIGGAPPSATVTIAARDSLAGEAGSNTGALVVMRTGSTASALTVQYSVNGTATPGADYVALSGTITIPAGASNATITVTPIDDALVEMKETVVVTLVADAGYTVGTSSTTKVTITSDDVAASTTVAPRGAQGLSRFTRP
jgi:hypothetical protein